MIGLGGLFSGLFGGEGGGLSFDFELGPDARTTDPDRFPSDMMPGYSQFSGGTGTRGSLGKPLPNFPGVDVRKSSHEFWTPVFEQIQSNYDSFSGGAEFNPLEGLELPGIEVVGDATDGSLKLSGWGLSDPDTAGYFGFRTNESTRFKLNGEDSIPDGWLRAGGGIMDSGNFFSEGPHNFFEWEVPEITLDSPEGEQFSTSAADITGSSTASDLIPASTIEGLYQSVLGRSADASGLEFWRSSGLEGDELREAFMGGAAPELSFNSQAGELERALWGLDVGDWRQVEQLDRLYNDMRLGASNAYGDNADVVLSRWDERVSGPLGSLKSQIEAERGRIKSFEDGLFSSSDDILSRISGLSIGDQDGIDAISREIAGLRRDAGRFSSELTFDLSQEMGSAGLGAAEDALSSLIARRSAEERRVSDARSNFTQQADALAGRLRAGGFGDLAQLQRMKSQADRLRDSVTGFETELDADFSGLLDNRLPDLDYAYEAAVRARGDQLSNYEMSLEDLISEGGRIKDYNEGGLRGMMAQLDALSRSSSGFTGGDRSEALRGSIRDARNEFSSRLDDFYSRRDELPGEARGRLSDLRETEFYDTDQIASARDDLEAFSDTLSRYGMGDNRSLSQALSLLSEEEARLLEDEANAASAQDTRELGIAAGGQMVPFYGSDGTATPISNEDYRQLLSFMRSFGNRGEEPYAGYIPFSASQMIRV